MAVALFFLSILFVVPVPAQPAPGSPPKFEIASVKSCAGGDPAPDRKSGGRGGGDFSPSTFHLDCTVLLDLIKSAYVLFADGHVNPRSRVPVEGGPAWIQSERFRIDAKSGGAASQGMMHGPMLQALLEERFELRMHRETRDVPAYALTVAKGGSKLHPFQAGSCVPLDLKIFEQFPPPPLPELPKGKEYCGGIDPGDGSRWVAVTARSQGPNVTMEARALSVDDFVAHALGPQLDRPVLNRTGISGLFDFHLEYTQEDAPAGPAEAAGPSILTAIERQLGLRLERATGRGVFLVIDHVAKPSPN